MRFPEYLFLRHVPIYVWVAKVVSSFQVFQPEVCKNYSSIHVQYFPLILHFQI
jgi:hypothetical protein